MIAYKILVLDVNQKELYRHTIEFSESVSFPFDSVFTTLRFLYPRGVVFHVDFVI